MKQDTPKRAQKIHGFLQSSGNGGNINMKKKYETPKAEIIIFEDRDIIITSGSSSDTRLPMYAVPGLPSLPSLPSLF